MLCIFKFSGNCSICAVRGNSKYQVTRLIRPPACPMNHHRSSEHHGGSLRWRMNCPLPFRRFHGPLAGAVMGGGTPCTFALLHLPPLPLSLGPQITKLKQQLQRTKLSRSGKEKERGFPLQGDHAVRGTLRVCHPPALSPLPTSGHTLPTHEPLGLSSTRALPHHMSCGPVGA